MDELTATDLKSQLKKWENEFYKEHGRKPSKVSVISNKAALGMIIFVANRNEHP